MGVSVFGSPCLIPKKMTEQYTVHTIQALYRELVHHGVLPNLAEGEWPGRCDLYFDGWSIPTCLRYHSVCPMTTDISGELLAIPAAGDASLKSHIRFFLAHAFSLVERLTQPAVKYV
jgi:hypothetical protein